MDEYLIARLVLARFYLICFYYFIFKVPYISWKEENKRIKKEKRFTSKRLLGKYFLFLSSYFSIILLRFIAGWNSNNETVIRILVYVNLLMFPLDLIYVGLICIQISRENQYLAIKFLFIKRRYPISELRYKKGKIFLSLYHNNKKILILFEWLMEVNFQYFCIKKKQ